MKIAGSRSLRGSVSEQPRAHGRLALFIGVVFLFAGDLMLSSAALASCSPSGTPDTTNTYTTGNDDVTCNEDNQPVTNSMVNLNEGNDTLTGDDDIVYSNGGFLRESNQIYFDTSAPTGGSQIVVVTGAKGDDTITLNGGDFHGQVQGNNGNDVIVINGGEIHGAVLGDGLAPAGTTGAVTSGISTGNDIVIINDGEIFGNVTLGSTGTQATNTSQHDRAFLYGGTVHGEFQNGPGTDYTFLFGGTIDSSVEMQRGSINSVIVLDGADIETFEMQNANGNFDLAINPTIYLRSGSVGAGGLEDDEFEIWGNNNSSTWIIDPVNSADPHSIDPFADDIAEAFANASPNPDPDHLLTIRGEPSEQYPNGIVAFGNGDATVSFIGADNMSDHPNLLLTSGDDDDETADAVADDDEDENEGGIPTFDGDDPNGGTPSSNDVLNVLGESTLQLADVVNFEFLNVGGGSTLALTSEDYEFGGDAPGAVFVEGGSTLWLQSPDTEFATDHFELGAPIGGASFKPSDQYAAFDPGGMLFIAGVAEKEEADADEGDEAAAADEDDEEDAEVEFVRSHATFNVGDDTFANAGTINMINGVTGDTLTINGDYESDNGNLAIDTKLGTKKSDQLIVNGPVDGTTTVYVNNSNAGNNQSTKDVTIAKAPEGGLSSNSFRLGTNAITGKREVLDGAFSYRLGVSNTKAFLYGDLLDQVPGYVTSPSVAQTHVLSEFGTLYQRMGEMRSAATAGAPLRPEVWVRGNFSQANVDAKTGWDFDSDNQNILFGLDPGGFPGVDMIRVGVFAGYGDTDATVKARTFGRAANSAVDANGWTEGIYMTYFDVQQPGVGFYFDGIIKANQLKLDIRPGARPVHANPNADTFSGSAEIGYGIAFGGGWSLTPQGQLIGITVDEESFSDAFGVNVNVGESDAVIGRLGLQLQDSIPTASGGVIAPYVVANVYSNFDGQTDSYVNGTKLASDIGVTWGSVGGGLTASLGSMLDLYGSADYKFGDIEGWDGTVGLRAHW
jgi:outer membrane autotransporter protein